MSAVVSKIKPVNNVNLKEILHIRDTEKYTYVYSDGSRVRYEHEDEPLVLVIAVKPPREHHYSRVLVPEIAGCSLQAYMFFKIKEPENKKIRTCANKKGWLHLSRLESGGLKIGITAAWDSSVIEIEPFMEASLEFELGHFLITGFLDNRPEPASRALIKGKLREINRSGRVCVEY